MKEKKKKVLVKENLIEGFYENIYLKDVIEDNVLKVADLDRAMFSHTVKDIKKYQDILNLFFRINEVNDSHDLDDFHFPEEQFEALYPKIIKLVPQKNAKEANQKYDTASNYMLNKARCYFVKNIFLKKKLITDEIEISFEDYVKNPVFYTYRWHYDNVEHLNYDYFRENEDNKESGLYDLNSKDLDSMVPRMCSDFPELEVLRQLIISAILGRKIMLVPGIESAAVLYNRCINSDTLYKSDIEAVNASIAKIVRFMKDKEILEYFENNNDFTVYVKKPRKHKTGDLQEMQKDDSKEYLRRTTVKSYIEAYHNTLGQLYGFDLFEGDFRELPEYKWFKQSSPNKSQEPIDEIFARTKEDMIVSYKENIDWNGDFMKYELDQEDLVNCITAESSEDICNSDGIEYGVAL